MTSSWLRALLTALLWVAVAALTACPAPSPETNFDAGETFENSGVLTVSSGYLDSDGTAVMLLRNSKYSGYEALLSDTEVKPGDTVLSLLSSSVTEDGIRAWTEQELFNRFKHVSGQLARFGSSTYLTYSVTESIPELPPESDGPEHATGEFWFASTGQEVPGEIGEWESRYKLADRPYTPTKILQVDGRPAFLVHDSELGELRYFRARTADPAGKGDWEINDIHEPAGGAVLWDFATVSGRPAFVYSTGLAGEVHFGIAADRTGNDWRIYRLAELEKVAQVKLAVRDARPAVAYADHSGGELIVARAQSSTPESQEDWQFSTIDEFQPLPDSGRARQDWNAPTLMGPFDGRQGFELYALSESDDLVVYSTEKDPPEGPADWSTETLLTSDLERGSRFLSIALVAGNGDRKLAVTDKEESTVRLLDLPGG